MVATIEKEKKSLEKVWVNVYSSKLSDEEIRRLASKHNTENQGNVQTKWFERVTACRHWLYHMAGKRACQSMYMATNKVFLNMLSSVNFVIFDTQLFGGQ